MMLHVVTASVLYYLTPYKNMYFVWINKLGIFRAAASFLHYKHAFLSMTLQYANG